MTKSLAKSTATVGSMTLMSRILGFARDVVCARFFGATAEYDAFLVAFKIPNFMRAIFAEGAFSQAFVPLLSETQTKEDANQAKNMVDAVTGTLSLVLFVVTILGIVAAPLIILLFAPGFDEDLTRYELSVSLLRITFPYLLFISLTALAGGILNTYGRFASPAFTPVLLNVAMILTTIGFVSWFEQPIFALAWGVFIGGVLQLLFQIPFLLKLKLLPRPKIRFKDIHVKRLIKLIVPALFGVSVVQINLLLTTVFASFLPDGSLSWLYYADRLMQFPLGIIGVALATTVLPHLSKGYAANAESDFRHTLDWALRSFVLIALPAALGLCILAGPILVTLFHYGAFNVFDVKMTQPVLFVYGLGLVAFIGLKVVTSGFYARQDIKTPVRVAVIAVIANAGLSILLMPWLAHVGLAVATVVAAFINLSILSVVLFKRDIYRFQPGWLKFSLRILLASLSMAAILLFFSPSLHWWLEQTLLFRITMLFSLLFGSMAIYFGILWALGMRLSDFSNQRLETSEVL